MVKVGRRSLVMVIEVELKVIVEDGSYSLATRFLDVTVGVFLAN